MPNRSAFYTTSILWLLLVGCVVLGSSCNSTKHLKEGQYLLRSNSLKLKSDRTTTNKGELTDQLSSLVIQKPNKRILGVVPFKLWLYNMRYEKYSQDADNYQLQSKTVEPPVVYDSTLVRRTVLNMKSFLFNRGYFYARINDTVKFRDQKAYVTYRVETGISYLINKINLDIDDPEIKRVVSEVMNETVLRTGQPFSMTLLDVERSRLTNTMRNNGFYKFSNENITFLLDTLNKEYFRNVENPFESAINILTLQKNERKPTLDVKVIIRNDDDPTTYMRYSISSVMVLPDFVDRKDIRDSTMLERTFNKVRFRYHDYYIKERVLYKNIYLEPGSYYSQRNYDKTITQLNDLGLFQYVRITLIEDTSKKDSRSLRCFIVLNPAKRYDFNTNFEVSSGSTYALGSALGAGIRNRNLWRGGNQLSINLTGGVETGYTEGNGDNFIENFYLLSKNIGANASLSFPKFIAPVGPRVQERKNLPRTIVGFGMSLLDRVNYFTMSNTTANFTYNWKETQTKAWEATPAFINILTLPRKSDSFQRRLDTNQFLRNSYRENFIEGEVLAFTFSNQAQRRGRDYSYLRLAVEEAGGLMSGFRGIGRIFKNDFDFTYAQYVKFDFDGRHYLVWPRSKLAMRFYGGVGIPYDQSPSLPYIKQYFVGGAYSIRGWRIRSLGPGSYYNPNVAGSFSFIDRTGDIKLEMNSEYRFEMVKLLSGSIKLNGALFVDAGNIWLSNPDPAYPGGDFALNKLGRDIAMSTGAGARLDFGDFITFRIDAAFPVKKPYEPENGGWVFDKIKFNDPGWRSDNLILNIAIGYPF